MSESNRGLGRVKTGKMTASSGKYQELTAQQDPYDDEEGGSVSLLTGVWKRSGSSCRLEMECK